MDTAERLQGYTTQISPEVIDRVAEQAEWQTSFPTYAEFFEHMGIKGLKRMCYSGLKPVDILDIRQADEIPKTAILYIPAMANPLDPNNIYQAATVAKANPGHRLIAFGNLSGGFKYNSGQLSKQDRETVRGNSFEPFLRPVGQYFDNEDIEEIKPVGGSYGAEVAAEAAGVLEQFVKRAVLLDPVAVKSQRATQLAGNFVKSGRYLDYYVEQSGDGNFKAAREDSVDTLHYAAGLLRPTNVAAVIALAKYGFRSRLHTALTKNPEMRATVPYGTVSELSSSKPLNLTLNMLNTIHNGRINRIVLEGLHHAYGNDIYLQAALVAEGLR